MTTTSARPTLVVAGLSARLMAEAAARDGYGVIALDAFGDADTRRAAQRWQPIGRPGALRLDAERLLHALTETAADTHVIGWVAGSDLECEPELLERGAALLPLIGTAPDAVRRVRDPAVFFEVLGALGLPHPETQLAAPNDPRGWLCKHARSAGGWHIRPADSAHAIEPERRPYFQREQAGTPMSALIIGNGREARLIGCHELIVHALGARPCVYRGAIGPLLLSTQRLAALDAMLQTLTRTFSLRGLASLDFIDDGRQFWLLEINPRPSASMGLHTGALMRGHVEACLAGSLPAPVWAHEHDDEHEPALRGSEIVFARTALRLSAAQAAALAACADCHDLPTAGSRFEAGDPVCSVSACGASVAAVRAELADKRRRLRHEWAVGNNLPDSTDPFPPSPSGRGLG
ncbi:MAG: ATP-grasp domain-containing protein [Methylibium sp.]|uniref:ATP-grasp domain-containing protein n=1 Tax=Methylibium sp. TaxID=2067992 RepID=UPI0017C5C04C|nr:ATP-grasp domain-containing protein [Methylibium sp.]MBA3597108.1 ATP-grasp domain-containing protein [Methylibium sp.]